MSNSKLFTCLLFALVFVFGTACKSPSGPMKSSAPSTLSVAFYNVENLFDLIDDPKTLDDDFTPEGRNKWDAERYQKKLDQLTKVFEAMGFPDVIGVSEVENKEVMEALAANGKMKDFGYEVAHQHSPDMRGIDVAMLYKKDKISKESLEFIRVDFEGVEGIGKEGYTSRDILCFKGKYEKEDIWFFVNHWPSRRGGLEASQPKRKHVANHLAEYLVKGPLKAKDPLMVIMGDFNDEPDNESVLNSLGACPADSKTECALYNCMTDLKKEGKGSYNYRGNWNMLDQFIVSKAIHSEEQKPVINKTEIFSRDWMIYNDKKTGPKPNRTYGGPNYYGGFSDHFPILLELSF